MNFETFVLWLSVMVPLLFSPGPANITVSAIAGRFGLRKILPFVFGILTWNIISCFTIGLFFSVLHEGYDTLFHVIELLGSLYILYLSYKLFSSSRKNLSKNSGSHLKEPSYSSGLLMQVLNGKLYPVLSLMFSQFLDSHENIYLESATMTVLFVSLSSSNYLFWGALGSKMNKALGPKGQKLQLQISAGILGFIGLWMIKNNVLFH